MPEEENTGGKEKGTISGAASSLSHRLVCFFFVAVLVLVAAVFFQLQLLSLRRELAILQLRLTGCQLERLKNLEKRSAARPRQDELGQGIQAAHLEGTQPFQHIEKRGKIGPWSLSATDPAFVLLRKKRTEIEISQTGLYYLYAQVYYLTSEPHNSFQVVSYRGSQQRRDHRSVATCACQARDSTGELSCHTALTMSLLSGDRLYLHQIEQKRIVHFARGRSFFGIILLRKNVTLTESTRKEDVPGKN